MRSTSLPISDSFTERENCIAYAENLIPNKKYIKRLNVASSMGRSSWNKDKPVFVQFAM